jgi:hypothetical protein
VQIRLPEENPPLPHLAEVAVLHRVASSSPHHQGKPLGVTLPLPDPARVSAPSQHVGGGRRAGTIDPDLIGRPRALPIDSAPAPPGDWAPPVRWFESPSRARHAWSGPAQCGSAPDRQIPARIYLFPVKFFC